MIRPLLTTLAAVAAVAATPAFAFDWSDNALRYQFGPSFTEPFVTTPSGGANSISKNIVSFQHADAYKYGGNFLNIDVLFSSSADKAQNSVDGAREIYAIYRHDLSLNKVFGTTAFAFGPVRDVMLEVGVDLSTKNTAFNPRVAEPVGGVVLSLAVPGFWHVGVLADKEWNNNGFSHLEHGVVVQGAGQVEFDTTAMFATSWGVPLYKAFSFEGYGSFILPKGKDGGGVQTKSELLFHPRIMWDAGSLFSSKGYQIGVGYEYWLNKFGNDHKLAPGSEESTVVFEAAFHL